MSNASGKKGNPVGNFFCNSALCMVCDTIDMEVMRHADKKTLIS